MAFYINKLEVTQCRCYSKRAGMTKHRAAGTGLQMQCVFIPQASVKPSEVWGLPKLSELVWSL
jgi:hypothetical protein